MRVLLTGATGFLGAHLVRSLLDRGHTLRALVRASSRTADIEERGVEVVRGDFSAPSSLRAALDSIEVVVHAAGGGIATRVEDIYTANTASTSALIDAAPRTLRRFVLVSSLAAHGPALHGPATERDPDAPVSHYGKSKLLAEQAAAKAAELVVLRPPALYGPGEHRMVPLFRAARRGIVPMVHPSGTMSMLHGADCADAVAAAVDAPHPRGVYYVAEARVYGRREMAELIGRAVGRRVRVVGIPPSILGGLANAAELFAKIRGGTPAFTRDKVRDVSQLHQSCDPSRAMSVLAWSAKHDFERGAREAFDDYRRRGWL